MLFAKERGLRRRWGRVETGFESLRTAAGRRPTKSWSSRTAAVRVARDEKTADGNKREEGRPKGNTDRIRGIEKMEGGERESRRATILRDRVKNFVHARLATCRVRTPIFYVQSLLTLTRIFRTLLQSE